MAEPAWRRAFNAWEKSTAPALEDLTASTGFRDLLAAGVRWNNAIAEQVERTSRQWLHLWNLPAATDVRRLREQVARLQTEIGELRVATRQTGAPPTLTVIDGGGEGHDHPPAANG